MAAGLALLLVLLAFARPLDHDESQYVAAAALARHALVYRDFAYLQTPLQPLLFAPIAVLAGPLAFPALRLVNALLGAAAVSLVYAAAREAGADSRRSLIAAALFAGTDSFLFSAAVARNDMLPALLFAGALWLLVRSARGEAGRTAAILAGLMLSAAAAAKLSYAVPAMAVGGLALIDRRYRPGWLALGAAAPALLVAAAWRAAPDAFLFDVLRFPTIAPEQYYAAGRAWKLAIWMRGLDTVKFLALGAALPALIVAARTRDRGRVERLLDLLIVAGLVSALLPAPTWRQYLLPMLPPLFVRLALAWQARPPRRAMRIACAVFAAAGLAPSAVTLATSAANGLPLARAIRDGAAIRETMDRAGAAGPVATLSPQFVPATGRAIDPRFAAGPFYFRSDSLLSPADEARFSLVSRRNAAAALAAAPPGAILVGGEGAWTSGDARLDAALERIARDAGWRAVAVAGTPFRLYLAPPMRATSAWSPIAANRTTWTSSVSAAVKAISPDTASPRPISTMAKLANSRSLFGTSGRRETSRRTAASSSQMPIGTAGNAKCHISASSADPAISRAEWIANTIHSSRFGREKTRREKISQGSEIATIAATDQPRSCAWLAVTRRQPTGSATASIASVIALPATADRIIESLTAPNGAATRVRPRAQA